MSLINEIKNKKVNYIKDIFAGIIVALVSIPISMGYAQIAGLPPVYGLYGSLLPIIIFAFISSSRAFVVGVDAMPAVMVGSMLATLGIENESDAALTIVPLMSILVALMFLLFFIFKLGRIVKYISTPVMGGFISGVGLTIILMQIPKLFGGTAGTGTLIELIENIVNQAEQFNLVSFAFGIGTVMLLLICKKIIPKVPMTVIALAAGAVIQVIFGIDRYGVKLLPNVTGGLPPIWKPDFKYIDGNISQMIMEAFSIALVIMAQTLLASGSYAAKYGDKLDNNRELLAYAGMNIATAVSGSCPINGSVSRSGIADSFGARSQVMSLAAGISMLFVLLFGTSFLKLLPVPILTGIVIVALIGILDTGLAKRLWKTSRNELVIFILSMLGVLLFGTVNGVVIGCVLSFFEVAIRVTTPPIAFVGRIENQGNFYALSRNKNARPIKHAIIYRFGGNLFFANIDRFQNDIERAIKPDTRCVIVDARGISSIDITATDRLVAFGRGLLARGIRFYITEHEGTLNDQIRSLGGAVLIEEGHVRRTITLALRDAGIEKPYELEEPMPRQEQAVSISEQDNNIDRLAELEWAFGDEAPKWMEKLAYSEAEELVMAENEDEKNAERIIAESKHRTGWGLIGRFDENEYWDFLEVCLEKFAKGGRIEAKELRHLLEHIEARRIESEIHLKDINPKALELLKEHRERLRKKLKEEHPEEYEHIIALQKKYYEELKRKNPALAEEINRLHKDKGE